MKTQLVTPTTKIAAAATEFQQLLQDKQFLAIPKVGDVVHGTVLSVSKTEVQLNVDGYTSGVIRGEELYNESVEYSGLQVGDEVDATVVGLENELGELELSFRSAGHRKTWAGLSELQQKGEIVEVEIVEANKGGLLVRFGHLAGFLPVSQLAGDHYPRVPGGDKSKIQEKLKPYIGQKFTVKVLDVVPEEDKLIFSEKKIVDDELRDRIAAHRVGEVFEGPITAVTDFGAFLQFADNLTGLIHISELAWQRVEHPTDVVKVGDIVKAEIINIDGPKVFLSRKRLLPDPWKSVGDRYQVGQTVTGKVLKVNPFGLFIEIDPEIHGLAHVSEIDADVLASGAIKLGDVREFKVVSIQPAEHRLGLSIKALTAVPTPSQVSDDTTAPNEPAAS